MLIFHSLAEAMDLEVRWSDSDATLAGLDDYALADSEAGSLQPAPSQAYKRHGRWQRPLTQLRVVVARADFELARRGWSGCLIRHDCLLEIAQFASCSERPAGCLNTALGRPAVFPRRVLHGCAPSVREKDECKTYGRKQTAGLTEVTSRLERGVFSTCEQSRASEGRVNQQGSRGMRYGGCARVHCEKDISSCRSHRVGTLVTRARSFK